MLPLKTFEFENGKFSGMTIIIKAHHLDSALSKLGMVSQELNDWNLIKRSSTNTK